LLNFKVYLEPLNLVLCCI